MSKKTNDEFHQRLQIQFILSQLAALRSKLREALRAYEARLEIMLAEVTNEFDTLKKAKRFSSEQLDQIDSAVVLLRERNLKPEKGRQKDLRKIETLIGDLDIGSSCICDLITGRRINRSIRISCADEQKLQSRR